MEDEYFDELSKNDPFEKLSYDNNFSDAYIYDF